MLNQAEEPERKRIGRDLEHQGANGRTLQDLDAVDLRIIALLQENGRYSNIEMARIIGCSEPTVRKRLEKLVTDGILKVTAVLNPRKTGYNADIVMGIRTKPGKMLEVGEQLARMNEVVYVGYVSGRYDIIAEFLYRNHSELLTFLTECLASFEDIVSTESFHVLHTAKINYDWKLPDEFLAQKEGEQV